MVKMTMNELDTPLTAEEINELESAQSRHPVFDDDSPEMSFEQLMKFKQINRENRTRFPD